MDEMRHYGIKRRSGRYPWGSGDNSKQSSEDFLKYINELRDSGMSDVDIATSMGMSTTELRQRRSIAKDKVKAANISQAINFKNEGMSVTAIGERMGRNESTIRSWLDPLVKARAMITLNIMNLLRRLVDEKGPIDVGGGTEAGLGISRTKMLTALRGLQDEGYKIQYVKVEQLGTGKETSIQVLTPPGMDYKELYAKRYDIGTIQEYSPDGGRTILGLKPVQSIDSSRILVRYKEDGGADKDGVIELRRGVNDLDLGNSKYAQVRIGVDGTHYLKGMAVYGNDIPDGYDVIYNVSKPRSDFPTKKDVFKEMVIDKETGEVDMDNPFGAKIKREGQLGALNIVNDQGDWSTWSKNISSQVLSKQKPTLAQKQLKLDADIRKEELDEINQLTNPAVKEYFLQSFADKCDAGAVDLKAAALPRQASHVILPLPNMNEKEVYAPMYRDGENVALIRYPHGGIFEIPELKVNNKYPPAKDILGNAPDAIGIHPNVAQKLSGADFDGDTVLVIPNDSGKIKTSPSLKALRNFDPREVYKGYDGMPEMSARQKQMEMGKVSNLITDMTIKGASQAEIARAVKHSMVVIDAEKHKLNYKQSAIDNGIAQLKEKYQGGSTSGASTLISRASSQTRINERKEGILVTDPKTGAKRRLYVDPETGEKLYTETGKTYVNRKGKVVRRQQISTEMAEAKDAFDLSSGTKMETIYAEYANELKGLANQARKEALNTPKVKYSRQAAKVYEKEIDDLNRQLKLVDRNRPKERQAQLAANKVYRAKLQSNKDLEPDQKKRLRGQALAEARARLGAKKPEVILTDRQWTAIQMGALSHNKVSKIIRNTDQDKLKERAIPRTAYKMTSAKVNRAKTMATAGYTAAEIASALGVSATTVQDTLNQ